MISPEEKSVDNGELWSLAEAVCNGTIAAEQYARLNALLLADEAAARRYATYVRMHGLLLWRWQGAEAATPSVATFPVVLESPWLSAAPAPLLTSLFSPGGYLFSYSLAALIVAMGMLLGWMYQVSSSRSDPRETVRVAPAAKPASVPAVSERVVGRVTGMVDCRWADPKTATVVDADVVLRREYALAGGLIEISYRSGAHVILQGPCTYSVESPGGGYLSLGRLTARVGERGERRGERESRPADRLLGVSVQQSTINNQQLAISNQQSPSPLFVVRTPTARISDLGTEFGVEVDKSGASKAHVYRGKVEMRAIGGGAAAIYLRANESARAEAGAGGIVLVVRQSSEKIAFLRELPHAVPIRLFNTGVGLKGGQADLHWQIAARSDDRAFRPQSAVVRGWRDGTFLPDDPGRSQWISLIAGDGLVPQDVVYVFRTTFDLTGMLPATAVVRGKFMGDDRIIGMRLNGRRLSVPRHRDTGPFFEWTNFRVSSGFVRGRNVLEFDVLNSNPVEPPGVRRVVGSRMSFRAELEGQAAEDPGLAGSEADGRVWPRKGAAASVAR
jgi:hypothetical protein